MPYTSTEPRIYYEVTGHGPPIVWSHGLLMDREMFSEQVAAFSKSHTCITWDERAHGKTASESCGHFNYYDSAEDLMRILDDLEIPSAILAGMSQGGYLSLRAALRYPERVRGLILIATQAAVEDTHREDYYKRFKAFASALEQDSLNDDIWNLAASVIMDPAWSGTEYWVSKWRKLKISNVRSAFECMATRDDIEDLVHKITVPSLVIHGTKDLAIPISSARRLSETLANAKLFVVKGENHATNMTSPGVVNRAIDSFLHQKLLV